MLGAAHRTSESGPRHAPSISAAPVAYHPSQRPRKGQVLWYFTVHQQWPPAAWSIRYRSTGTRCTKLATGRGKVPAPAAANCGFHLALESSLTQIQNPLLRTPYLTFASSSSSSAFWQPPACDPARRFRVPTTLSDDYGFISSRHCCSWSPNLCPPLLRRHTWPPPRRARLATQPTMVSKEFLDSDRVNFLIWR